MQHAFRFSAAALLAAALWLAAGPAPAAVVDYHLTIAEKPLNITGRAVPAMTVNGTVPGPVLHFREGDTARIRVTNKMAVDTSIHWHGILVPPGMDGVPNISFPPIEPGRTFTYEFPIRQSGTYWYHSHSRLQEQRGVYGAIVIQPRERRPAMPERVVVLSDWTDRGPDAVLHDLKRGSEWMSLSKGSGQSILGAAKLGMLGDYFARELGRMPPMDIADVAYDRFLANGRPVADLGGRPGETVRLRLVNGSASTFFLLTHAGGPLTIVAADGQEVEPAAVDRLLIGVAETYDLLLKIPARGSAELRATAHDSSSWASMWLGEGRRLAAEAPPRPNLYHVMGGLSPERVLALTPAGSMGMPDAAVRAGRFDRPGMAGMHDMGEMQGMSGMKGMGNAHQAMTEGKGMSGEKGMTGHGDMAMDRPAEAAPAAMAMDHGVMAPAGTAPASTAQAPMTHGSMTHGAMADMARAAPEALRPPDGRRFADDFGPLAADVASSPQLAVDGIDPRRPWPPYAKLRSPRSTALDPRKPLREIRLTLDGDMERYVWLLNGEALSEADDILIREGEAVRFIMINRTMMHHPMHLHGHFFRVVNGQGDHAPLKHTVDVAPMSTTVIEFDANERGDWFFHCHLLYHMKAGMARLVHYDGFLPPPAVLAVRPNLYAESWYAWARAEALSNMTEGYVRLADTRNIFTLDWEAGWQRVEQTEWEGIVTYDRYLNRFTSLLVGADLMGEKDRLDRLRGVGGLRYLLPLNIESTMWLDTDLGARIDLEKDWDLTPRLSLLTEVRYDTHERWEGAVGLAYAVTGNLSLEAKWHSDYAWGGGLMLSF